MAEQIGHIIGLRHSGDHGDVMAPFYRPDALEIALGDKQAYAALVSAV